MLSLMIPPSPVASTGRAVVPLRLLQKPPRVRARYIYYVEIDEVAAALERKQDLQPLGEGADGDVVDGRRSPLAGPLPFGLIDYLRHPYPPAFVVGRQEDGGSRSYLLDGPIL